MVVRAPQARLRQGHETDHDDRADALVAEAKETPLQDGGLRTADLIAQALACVPHHHEAQLLQERLHQMFVPRWHFPMMGDADRNRAYADAIRAKVRPGDIVLDIGCGAGLTAMMAARAGAKHVYTCEQQPLIAQAARKVIADNGLSDRITVIPKLSHHLVVGKDLPEPADVVISEIVDTVLLGEGAMATLTHAMVVLAKPEARTVPEQGILSAQLVESDRLMEIWRPGPSEGFDLQAFHDLARVAYITPNDFAVCGLRALSTAEPLFDFNFAWPNTKSQRNQTTLTCSAPGTIHAVLVSFGMTLAPGHHVTNDLSSSGHWGRTAFLLKRPRAAQVGDNVTIVAQHDSAHLSLFIDEVAPIHRPDADLPSQPNTAHQLESRRKSAS